MVSVTWFRNGHEQRNDLARFGFMRLHQQKQLTYVERPLAACEAFGFPRSVAIHDHRHTSVLLIEDAGRERRCLIDGEDSFFWMSPLIADVDLYFCSGYNTDFFERRSMLQPLPWQTPAEVQFYRDRTVELVGRFGDHFHKARKFIPIGPAMGRTTPVAPLEQKLRNLRHRWASLTSDKLHWPADLANFEVRYAELTRRRSSQLRHDVVLLDTLWGWPRHRLALHQTLQDLSAHRDIHSRLNWSDPVPFDGSQDQPLDRTRFPLSTQPVEAYEQMLSESRLAVFATGFHWGWRAIMSVALLYGLPVYMDPARLEPWFDLNAFQIFWNDTGDWRDLDAHLAAIGPDRWQDIKQVNQARYDQVMAPEAVANYLLEAALA